MYGLSKPPLRAFIYLFISVTTVQGWEVTRGLCMVMNGGAAEGEGRGGGGDLWRRLSGSEREELRSIIKESISVSFLLCFPFPFPSFVSSFTVRRDFGER